MLSRAPETTSVATARMLKKERKCILLNDVFGVCGSQLSWTAELKRVFEEIQLSARLERLYLPGIRSPYVSRGEKR